MLALLLCVITDVVNGSAQYDMAKAIMSSIIMLTEKQLNLLKNGKRRKSLYTYAQSNI